jgi:hypothetical protein
VPNGVQVPCAKLFEPADITKRTGFEIGEVRDDSGKDKSVTADCVWKRSGTPPSKAAQERAAEKNDGRLGVQPGEPLCRVTINCWLYEDEVALLKTCKDEGNTVVETAEGDACDKQTRQGEEFAHRLTAVDRDTRCRVVTRGGPSVTDLVVVQKCAEAALAAVSPESLQ